MPKHETISLIEAVHDLRLLLDLDVRQACTELINILATGQMPPAVSGDGMEIDPRWWSAPPRIEYPNSSATFNLIIDGEERLTRVTDIALDLKAWERLRAQLAATPAARLSAQESMEEYAARRRRAMRAPESTLAAIESAPEVATFDPPPEGRQAEIAPPGLPTPLKVRSGGHQRGPIPKVFARVKEAMTADIRLGARDPFTMLEKTMKDTYQASRDTCRKVRTTLEREMATNSDK